MYRKQITQDQINAHRDTIRAELAGKGFAVNSNRASLHIRCTECGNSNTLNPEMWARGHHHHTGEACDKSHDAPRMGRTASSHRVADYREDTVNADGTTNTTFYYV